MPPQIFVPTQFTLWICCLWLLLDLLWPCPSLDSWCTVHRPPTKFFDAVNVSHFSCLALSHQSDAGQDRVLNNLVFGVSKAQRLGWPQVLPIECPCSELLSLPPWIYTLWDYLGPGQGGLNSHIVGDACNLMEWGQTLLLLHRAVLLLAVLTEGLGSAEEPSTCLSICWTETHPGDTVATPQLAWLPGPPLPPHKGGVGKKRKISPACHSNLSMKPILMGRLPLRLWLAKCSCTPCHHIEQFGQISSPTLFSFLSDHSKKGRHWSFTVWSGALFICLRWKWGGQVQFFFLLRHTDQPVSNSLPNVLLVDGECLRVTAGCTDKLLMWLSFAVWNLTTWLFTQLQIRSIVLGWWWE